jgi:2-hydroxy-6-oxonona-2,4-dienedioate hydrolase
MTNMEYPAHPAVPAGKFVPVEDGHLFVIDIGEGYPTIFLHGGGPGCSGWTDFGPVVPYFGDRRLLLVDMLQRGQSSYAPIDGPVWSTHGQAIVQMMDSLGIERADFVCSSIGGSAALALAADHPSRVHKVILTGSAPMSRDRGPSPYADREFNGLEWVRKYYANPTWDVCREIMALGEWFDETKIPDQTVDIRFHQSMNPENLATWADDRLRGEPEDLEGKLGAIEAPILFFWAAHDPMAAPEYGLSLRRTVRRGDFYMMDHVRHHLEEERPADYSAIALAFLDRPEQGVSK